MTGKRAIVTDAVWRKSVSAIRSLGRAGLSVSALGESWLATGLHSRFTRERLTGPSAGASEAGFGRLLARAIASARPERPVVLPMEDESCWWLLKNGERLRRDADWLLPDFQSFGVASDKAQTMRLATELGVPCPLTLAPASVDELIELHASKHASGWLVKPAVARGSAGVLYDDEITSDAVRANWNRYGALLLQQRIPASGTASGVSLLYDGNGRCRAVFCHRRLRQYPVTGGPSTSRVSVAVADMADLVGHSRKLLEHLQWRGVAMVEWKRDPESGRDLLLEVNPRFWGSLELAVRSGVDFPLLYARAAAGEPLPDEWPAYRAGVICRWMIPGEILRYLGEPASTREPLREFLRGSVRNSEEFAADDIRGSIACVVCPALLALNPRYWRYLRRASAKPSQ